jgi:hypothetical protein
MGSRAGAPVPTFVVGSPTLVDCLATTDRLCVAPMTLKPVGCGRVSRRAQPGPDNGQELRPDDESAVPEQRSTPESLGDNTVTRIMPVIAPWPDTGAEPPPTPPAVGSARVETRSHVSDVVDVPATPGTAVGLTARHTSDVVRPGPTAFAEDSWDDTPEPVPDASSLAGRRAQMPSRRTWVVLVAVLIGLGAVAAVPFVLSSQPKAPLAAPPDGSPTALDELPPGFVPDPSFAQSTAPLAVGGSATPAPSQSPSQSPSPSQGQAANPTTESTTGSVDAPPFEPLTIEAETGTTTGIAHIWEGYPNASGGNMVRNLGNWDHPSGPGTLTLNEIVFPNDAEYTFTIYFAHPNDEDDRSALVTVLGLDGVWVNFTAVGPDCCYVTAVTIAVSAGTRSITFSNETGHSPSIDVVVITRA